jgi:predicted kinase
VHRETECQRPAGGLVPRPGLAGRSPAAVIVSGPAASGKTTLATALASALHYAIMDLDTVTGPLTRNALLATAHDEAAIDSPAGIALRATRYETLLDVAAANLAVGIGVVIAAPFTSERSSRERFREVLRRLTPEHPDARVALLYIDTPHDVVRARLEARGAARDQAKLSQTARPTTSAPELVPEALVIDGTQPPAAQLAQALGVLSRPGQVHGNPRRATTC